MQAIDMFSDDFMQDGRDGSLEQERFNSKHKKIDSKDIIIYKVSKRPVAL